MGVSEKRRVTRSAAEWAELFERFGASRLTVGAFCEREKISKSSFARWKRLLSEQAPAAPSEFVEWTSAAAPALATTTLAPGELLLSLPGGVRLRFRP
jgi:hypothetical protein